MSEDLAARYKETVCLPATSFPMKANLAQTEPARIETWLKTDLHGQMLARNKGRKKFVMPDGPPYANSNIHVGTALNKILKDITIKFRNLNGEYAAFIPGWDCHGLPIELNITKRLGPKLSSTSEAEIRQLCREEAKSWVAKQASQFQRLGVVADWAHPYLTLAPEYEAEEIRVLARINDNGVFVRGEKPVNWDPALQTALAAAEVEYKNHRSPSVYVKFALTEASKKKLGVSGEVSMVIWTTTPWTLPANYGIALHPEITYSLLVGTKESFIVAQALSEAFGKVTGLELTEQKTFSGSTFDNLEAQHPFLPRSSRLLLGEHVTVETGTGCVHTAPAHGMDDYIVGQKYGLPTESPVDQAGKFNDSFAEMKGVSIWEGNKLIIEKLKNSGHLLAVSEIEHQYPYGPRSKKPLIFRATPQWFVRMDDEKYPVRKKALAAAEKDIQFIPAWGAPRLNAMISNSPDWCLSRQRMWGVPVPVFYCQKCSTPLVDSEVMRKLADVMEKSGEGMESYYVRPESEFTAGKKCSKCAHTEFKRGKDILDVWFDSGACHSAVQKRRPELDFSADIYIEGSDQHRGWFQTSLMSAIASDGKPPYKTLVTHGFVNDAQGFKMSKSVGNVVDPADVIKESGAEILRLWVAHEDFGDDLTISKEMLARISDTYRRFRNTIRFMLGNLQDFDPQKDRVEYSKLTSLDQWALAQLAQVIEKCHEAYTKFEYYKVYHALNNFFTVDLSATYLDILKDRLYTSKKEGLKRRSSQTVLFELLHSLCSLMAPIASFLAEETYSYIPGEKKTSVFLAGFPEAKKEWQRPELREKFAKLLLVRAEVSKVLEDLRRERTIGSGLDASVTVTAPKDVMTVLREYEAGLKEFFIVSQVSLKEGEPLSVKADKAKGEKCVRCWHYSEQIGVNISLPGVCPKCVEALS